VYEKARDVSGMVLEIGGPVGLEKGAEQWRRSVLHICFFLQTLKRWICVPCWLALFPLHVKCCCIWTLHMHFRWT
jgi:hypothetical protein